MKTNDEILPINGSVIGIGAQNLTKNYKFLHWLFRVSVITFRNLVPCGTKLIETCWSDFKCFNV
jgi:hypothetical protein